MTDTEEFKFFGDVLFGYWHAHDRRYSPRYIESHVEEFEWRPYEHNPQLLWPWRDGQALRYEETMGEA